VSEWVEENGWGGKISVTADFVGTEQTFGDAQHIGELSCLSQKWSCQVLMLICCSASSGEDAVCWYAKS
jgi:hypothetical protein